MRLVVARVGRAHGIRGEVTIAVHTDDPGARFAPGSVLFTAGGIATALGYGGFFVLTTVALLPAMALFVLLWPRLRATELAQQAGGATAPRG